MGEYRLLRRLGEGGMGVVHLGCSPGGQLVAVKVVHASMAGDTQARARFRREVEAVGQVNGAFTARLLKADPDADPPWLVTTYLPGLSLGEAVGMFGGLPTDAVRLLAAAAAEALAEIHRVSLTHRDLTPGNIMLTARGPRVIDFGIARPADATDITRPGSRLGTPRFMSPEQASGGRPGPPADVFALGAVLVFAATGKGPFDAETRAETLRRISKGQADLTGLSDRRLRALVVDCLHLVPERRPSPAELLDRLGEPVASVHGTRWLPGALAQEIGIRAAQAPSVAALVAEPLSSAASTADPAAETADAPGSPPGALRKPTRRRLLMATASLPVVAGAVALSRTLLSVTGGGADEAASSHSSSGTPTQSPSEPGPAPPPEAEQRWKVKVLDADAGPASLFAAGSVVLAYGVASEDKADVHALNPGTGEVLWTRPTKAGIPDQLAVGDDVVYLIDPSDERQAVDAVQVSSGTTVWTYRPEFGSVYAVTPAGELTFISAGGIVAVDTRDGGQLWTSDTTAFSLTADSEVVVADNGEEVTVLDAASGRIRWRYTVENAWPVLAGDGLVFAFDSYLTLHVLRVEDGEVAWQRTLDYPSSVHQVENGLLCVSEPDGRIHALRAGTGETLWSRHDSDFLGLSGGTVYVASAGPRLHALETVGGGVLWTYGTAAARSWGSGVVTAHGLVCVGTEGGHVEALSPPANTS
ncbi:protein kinase domain-containing protein [Streptomyces sp. URMC 129]|uniref:protein kinase domain-containing protein n=1 Tax=Streptomyces sp. URMC 129 TaxID=3423407 RepID=UPI003F1B5BF5